MKLFSKPGFAGFAGLRNQTPHETPQAKMRQISQASKALRGLRSFERESTRVRALCTRAHVRVKADFGHINPANPAARNKRNHSAVLNHAGFAAGFQNKPRKPRRYPKNQWEMDMTEWRSAGMPCPPIAPYLIAWHPLWEINESYPPEQERDQFLAIIEKAMSHE